MCLCARESTHAAPKEYCFCLIRVLFLPRNSTLSVPDMYSLGEGTDVDREICAYFVLTTLKLRSLQCDNVVRKPNRPWVSGCGSCQ